MLDTFVGTATPLIKRGSEEVMFTAMHLIENITKPGSENEKTLQDLWKQTGEVLLSTNPRKADMQALHVICYLNLQNREIYGIAKSLKDRAAHAMGTQPG